MAKAIYCLKLQMLKIPAVADWSEKGGVGTSALFVALVYWKQWHEAPISVKAPLNDVALSSSSSRHTRPTVAKAAEQPCRRHLCYVSEKRWTWPLRLQGLMWRRKQMVKALDKPALEEGTQRFEGKKNDDVFLLSSLRPSKTWSFFQKTRRGRGLSWPKDPALLERRPNSRRSERAIGPEWSRCADRASPLVQR
ncbi:hypothetical protein GWK47_034896 [Chionoecetes opilio]|uniref:Uncharacterized protein n=1 Tax=Chionoecetes opilio TaxID=41210 RepID=A0A8J4YNL5_CHIOP|nr:hypothetical protein GWK47_034896 [Chionoecetes opilio]